VAALLGELIPLAHAGHWLVSLVYAAPVIVVGLALLRTWWKERREGPFEDEDVAEPF
jgi:uncharacterized membrane protein HdeD (DUF308 family)